MIPCTIAMRPNLLKIHLNYKSSIITTGRDEVKGLPGDIFKIEGDSRLWVLIHVDREGKSIQDYAETNYIAEGYYHISGGVQRAAIKSLADTLIDIYGHGATIYEHQFMVLHLKETDLR